MSDRIAAAEQIIAENVASVREVCDYLSIGRADFYKHRGLPAVKNLPAFDNLTPRVIDIFWRHRRRYGTRRIVDELKDQGIPVSRRTVANILKNQGLKAIQPKSFQPRTTESRHRLGYSPNLLLGDFTLRKINQLWVADITYVPLAGKRFAYLAMVMDRFSRRLIG